MSLPQTTTIYGNVIPQTSKNIVTLKVDKNIGFSYPLVQNPKRGYFHKSSGLDLVKNNLRQLLRTDKGERFMLPEYGCNIKNYLMEPLDQTTFNEVKTQILQSISRYLKQVSVFKLQVFETDTSVMNIKLFCGLKDETLVRFDTNISI